MKKIHELGAKTGLNTGELEKITKFGILGIAALALASLAACFKSNKADLKPAQPSAQEQPKNLQEPANSVNPVREQTPTVTDGGIIPPSTKNTPHLRQEPTAFSNGVNTSTAPVNPKDRGDGSQNCGPYPGYPCGTRYYTVSVSDFKA